MDIFLGYFFKWDPVEIKKISKNNGFKYGKKIKKQDFMNFADIDDNLISIHHWLKWLNLDLQDRLIIFQ